MSVLLTKTTRRGKTIVVTLSQDQDQDRISITVDGDIVELDEDATAGTPILLGPKTEKNMGLEPGAVSFGTTVLTGKEYDQMNEAWSNQSPRYREVHERIQEDRRRVQTQREEYEDALRKANAEREQIPDEPTEEDDPQEHSEKLVVAERNIDRAAQALRQFEALQKSD